MSQYQHEAVLREHLEALGTKVELGVELQDIKHYENGVAATLLKHGEGGTEIEHATFSYIIGADGGKGEIHSLGLSLSYY